MPSNTTNYDLVKPDRSQTNWDGLMNGNLDAIDAALASLQTQINAVGGTLVPVSFSSSAVVDFSQGLRRRITLAGDWTATFSNPAVGQIHILIVQQDSTGNHQVTWPSNVDCPVQVGLAANTETALAWVYNDSTSKYVMLALPVAEQP